MTMLDPAPQLPPTALSELRSTLHGRSRREERDIDKISLQRARRYGMEETAKHGRTKYTYGGVVFIYDPTTNQEVTSYPSSDAAPESSGTMRTKPILLSKKKSHDNDDAREIHERKRDELRLNRDRWTSHSVLVVDMSGSMRRDDVNGARCRSDGVWMALARDYVRRPLERGQRCDTDIVSVVVMNDDAKVVLMYEPTTWVLYNKLVILREWSTLRPNGAGNYLPALVLGEKLLKNNCRGGCALSLLFFSDGKPSDKKEDFAGKMGEIAAKFGRRLSMACVGMAEPGEDFSALDDMVSEAKNYGASAAFGKPSLDADSLSHVVTSLATSLTTSVTEMTDLGTGQVRKLRTDLKRERIDAPDDPHLTGNWTSYEVNNVWTWDSQLEFVQVTDPRCYSCWEPTDALLSHEAGALPEIGTLCPGCKACCFCYECFGGDDFQNHRMKNSTLGECATNSRNRRLGKHITKNLPSWNIAVKDQVFGEGAERIVRKFRFLDKDSNFLGPIMVAKESRFVKDGERKASGKEEAYNLRMGYHETFMRSQTIASDLAEKFNCAIDGLACHFSHPATVRRFIRDAPRIKFLEPMVVEAYDPDHGGEYNILIEPFLTGKYEKFNDNMGMVKGEASKVGADELSKSISNLNLDDPPGGKLGDLDAIAEGSEDEDDEDDLYDGRESTPESGSYDLNKIKPEYFPQTFSHYTYEKSNRRFMVVDLQGGFYTDQDGRCGYMLTDPVVHKNRRMNKTRFKTWTFGRTDRGEKGMKAFFITHKCNDVCRLLGLKETKL